MLSGDELKLMLMTASVSIGLCGLAMTIRNRWIDKKRSLLIEHGCQGVIAQFAGGETQFQHMALTITVTNNGSVPIFINRPRLKLPRKVDGYDTYELMNLQETATFPLKLEPGANYTARHSLRHFAEEFANKVKPKDKLRFQVTDNLRGSYFSRKIRFCVLIKHIETEDLLLARG